MLLISALHYKLAVFFIRQIIKLFLAGSFLDQAGSIFDRRGKKGGNKVFLGGIYVLAVKWNLPSQLLELSATSRQPYNLCLSILERNCRQEIQYTHSEDNEGDGLSDVYGRGILKKAENLTDFIPA